MIVGQLQELTVEKQLSKACLQQSCQYPLTVLVKEVVTMRQKKNYLLRTQIN